MATSEDSHKERFQLERLIFFSDAVFAIAITLLVIEIKVPALHGPDLTESALLHEVWLLVPKFFGFIISFFLIGLYWTRHHLMFGYVARLTPRLMWLNLYFLLTIVLMPFSTGVFGEYSTPSTIHLLTPFIIYVTNVCLTGVFNLVLWRYIAKKENNVAAPSLNSETAHAARTRAATVTIVFAAAIPVAFINPYAARYVPLLIPFVMRLLKMRKRKVVIQ